MPLCFPGLFVVSPIYVDLPQFHACLRSELVIFWSYLSPSIQRVNKIIMLDGRVWQKKALGELH